MGWLFTQGMTRRGIVAHITRTQESDSGRWTSLAHTVRGNVVWSVIEHLDKSNNSATKYIGCFLIGSEKDYGWGYKDMTESMGPYYYSCPLRYLDMAPVTNEGWREKVRAYHATRTAARKRYASAKAGQVRKMINSVVPYITLQYKRKRTWVGSYDGKLYRIPSRMLGDIKVD